MSITLSASHSQKLLLLFQSHNLLSSLLLRHFVSLSPQRHQKNYSIVNEAIQILQLPDNQWNRTQIDQILFSDPAPSPALLFEIAHRLGTSSKARKFLQLLQEKSSFTDTQSLSCTLQAVFELASREPDACTNLFELYNSSKEWSIPLTIHSITILLRCLGKNGLVGKLLVFFNELDDSLKTTHVRNVLIDLLLKAGNLDNALKMLDEMLLPEFGCPPNDVTADIVFSWVVKSERVVRAVTQEEIIELVLKLSKHGVFPNSIMMTQLIGVLCRNGNSSEACHLFFELMKLGAAFEAAPCNALLTGLGRNGDLDRMNEVMAKMKEMKIDPNVITFGVLINHLCKTGRVDGALELFEKMNGHKENDGFVVEPDVVIFNTLIDGLCKVGRQEEGLHLLERMKSQNRSTPNTVTYNCLIDGFCKVGEIEKGLQLFDEMKNERVVPNAVTINILVDGMCRLGRTNSALQFLNEMRNKGMKSDAYAYTSLINAFCNVNNVEKAIEIFDRMSRDGCSPDLMVYYSLISGLSQSGRMKDALSVFLKLKEAGFRPDVVCYNVLIIGFCNKKMLDKVYEMLSDMEEAGVKPDIGTYNTLISHFSKIGEFGVARRMMRRMKADGLAPTVVTCGAIINAYCMNGNVEEAMEIFMDMEASSRLAPNTVIYNILIGALCEKNDVEHAISLFDAMAVKGVKPNTITYNAIFKGLEKKKWLKQALELMDKMVEQNCDPDYITMEILTEWFSAVGEMEKLKNFVQRFQVSVSAA